jgi:hypothetical protein
VPARTSRRYPTIERERQVERLGQAGGVYDLWVGAYEIDRGPNLWLSTPARAQRGKVDKKMNVSVLPKRSGSRPRTTPTNPHTQLEQNPERDEVVEELARRVFALPGVEERPSAISVPGARSLWLLEEVPAGPPEAFMIGREFAHIHPMPDGSLHAALPPEVAQAAVEKGWAEQHPVARMGYISQNVVMIYAPRNVEEIEVVAGLVAEACRYAGGTVPNFR